MRHLILLLIIFPCISWSQNHLGTAGQIVRCDGSKSPNTSLVSLYGIRKWNYHPANLGNTVEDAYKTLQNRLRRMSPLRFEFATDVNTFFEFYAQQVAGVDLLNEQDWEDSVIQNCQIYKAVLGRKRQFNEDRNYLVSSDVWNQLSPTTQVTLIFEQVLINNSFAERQVDLESIRRIIAYLVSEEMNNAKPIDFLKVTGQTKYLWMDFQGAYIDKVDFAKLPWPTEIKPRNVGCIQIRNSCFYIVNNSSITVDADFNISSIRLDHTLYQGHELANGSIVGLHSNFDTSQFTTFDRQGFLISGYLSGGWPVSNTLRTINGENVSCLPYGHFQLNSSGEVIKCTLPEKTVVGDIVLLQPDEVLFCKVDEKCVQNLKSFFNKRTNKGQFELIHFPQYQNKIILEVTSYRELSGGLSNPTNYGDFNLTISNGPINIANTINVFQNGRVARVAILLPTSVDHYLHRNYVVDVAPTGICPGSQKRFSSFISYYYRLRDDKSQIRDIIIAKKVKLPGENSSTLKEYNKFNYLYFNPDGVVSSVVPVPQECS